MHVSLLTAIVSLDGEALSVADIYQDEDTAQIKCKPVPQLSEGSRTLLVYYPNGPQIRWTGCITDTYADGFAFEIEKSECLA